MPKKYGDWALVIGAAEGIGFAFAENLAAVGYHLMMIDNQEKKLKESSAKLSIEYKIQVSELVIDLSSTDAALMIEENIQDLDIGILMYNVAVVHIGGFIDLEQGQHLALLRANCIHMTSLVHLLSKKMVSKGTGAIILMSSMAAFQGSALLAHYAATKAYTRVLAESLWYELKEKGVDVIACCPGPTNTPAFRASNVQKMSFFAPPILEPDYIAAQTLKYLGKKPSFVPGFWNKAVTLLIGMIFTRKQAVQIVSSNTIKMYG
jgi:uncharacterized protein